MTWLSSKGVAHLLMISERAVRDNALGSKYGDKVRYVKGRGRGGKILQIALEALPEAAQQKYLIEYLNREGSITLQNVNRPLDNCNEEQKSSAIRKLQAIESYNMYERQCFERNSRFSKTKCKENFIENWNKTNLDFPLSLTTFYRMLDSYKLEGIAGLIDNRGGHNKSSSSILNEIWKQFKSMYLAQTQPTIKQCYNDVRLLATEKGIPIPSYEVFKYQVKNIPKPEIILGRYGKKAYMDSCEPTPERNYSPLRPNQIWVADGHIWDVFIRVVEDGAVKIKVIRLWGVYWMDMRTRKILSFRLCIPYAFAFFPICFCFHTGGDAIIL